MSPWQGGWGRIPHVNVDGISTESPVQLLAESLQTSPRARLRDSATLGQGLRGGTAPHRVLRDRVPKSSRRLHASRELGEVDRA